LYTLYSHWRSTLRRLPIRYRKPYAARHSSVSWDLMIGRNPLWVAQQHGHSLLTMLRVYAAWTADSLETDAAAIR
jgi:integrase